MYLAEQPFCIKIELIIGSYIFAEMNFIKSICFIFILFVLNSCKNDIDINAPWKEIPVVNGLLDINSDVQYIRITKVFQNSSNLTPQQAAQIADSLYFDTLVVKIIDITNGTDTFVFNRVDTIQKDLGYFSNTKNCIYASKMKITSLSDVYKLIIFSPKSGNTYTSTTSIVAQTPIMNGINSSYTIDIYYDTHNTDRIIFDWDLASNGVIYNSFIRYYYTEYPKSNPSQVVTRYADQIISINESNPDAISPQFHHPTKAIEMNQFFINTFGAIPLTGDSSIFVRKVTQIAYVVEAGSNDIKTAIDLSKPNTTLLQVKPDFTNIQGGLGLFSSRSITIKNMPFDNTTPYDNSKNLTQGVSGFVQ